LVSQGEIAVGMARLDEATTAATAGEMSDPVAIGFSCCYLIFACERVRDSDRAAQWCQRLARMAADQHVQALRAVCRAHYGTVLMLRGEWGRAEVELTEAASVLEGAPREGADAFARLGELRRRQGRGDEAVRLIGQAEHHPLAIMCRAALALERGDPSAAAEGAARQLRSLGGRSSSVRQRSSCSPKPTARPTAPTSKYPACSASVGRFSRRLGPVWCRVMRH
jgi:hypothetical protein